MPHVQNYSLLPNATRHVTNININYINTSAPVIIHDAALLHFSCPASCPMHESDAKANDCTSHFMYKMQANVRTFIPLMYTSKPLQKYRAIRQRTKTIPSLPACGRVQVACATPNHETNTAESPIIHKMETAPPQTAAPAMRH